MKVFELDQEGGVLMAALRKQRAAEAERTGLHCSTIVNDMLHTVDPKKYGGGNFQEKTKLAFQEFGNVFEDVLADALCARIPNWVKPTPRLYRGVICSPDGWVSQSRTMDEIKSTWVSERDFLASLKFQAYCWQLLTYMLAWGAVRGRLHVLFVAGTYRPPFPNARTFIIKPTARELEANFQTITQHAIDRRWLSRRQSR